MKNFLISYWIQKRDDWWDLEDLVKGADRDSVRAEFIERKPFAKDIVVEEVEIKGGVVIKLEK